MPVDNCVFGSVAAVDGRTERLFAGAVVVRHNVNDVSVSFVEERVDVASVFRVLEHGHVKGDFGSVLEDDFCVNPFVGFLVVKDVAGHGEHDKVVCVVFRQQVVRIGQYFAVGLDGLDFVGIRPFVVAVIPRKGLGNVCCVNNVLGRIDGISPVEFDYNILAGEWLFVRKGVPRDRDGFGVSHIGFLVLGVLFAVDVFVNHIGDSVVVVFCPPTGGTPGLRRQ